MLSKIKDNRKPCDCNIYITYTLDSGHNTLNY